VTLKSPPTVQADRLAETFDVVLLSCKAFDLDDAITSFAFAVGPKTSIIPLLNGMLHLDVLDKKFGADRVLGGLCAIAVTLNEAREVVQLAPMQSLNFGERDGMLDECSAIAKASGHAPTGPFFQRTSGLLTTEGSPMTASMFRDIKAGLPVEADHVIGDLVARADAAKIPVPKLRIAYTHLKAYEKQRSV
jgi:2-dehydropantoate 2-reductase